MDQYVSLRRYLWPIHAVHKGIFPNKSFTETYVYGKRYEIEDLIALILKTIKHRGELHVGHVVDTVVLGRPVVFSDDQN